ncbi:HCNGP-like protein-domain-containing protein [Mycena filopes]|nr:HCNGP-like protein-domain-containing protein [Mycena filopes]
MLDGLVAYDDDSGSDSEEKAPSMSKSNGNDTKSKPGLNVSSESRKLQKSQIIIRRPAAQLKNRPRAVIADEVLDAPSPKRPEAESDTQNAVASSSHLDSQDELARIRALLRPPPIPGTEDWGIPPASTEPCDPAIQTKLAQFHALKTATPAKHFNDSLMGSRAFRNPHLYTKLVEFIDVDERSTNFPPALWAPADVEPACALFTHPPPAPSLDFPHHRDDAHYPYPRTHALVLHPPPTIPPSPRGAALPTYIPAIKAETQKSRAEQQSAAQAAGKRSQIAFTGSSTSTTAHKPRPKDKERERDRDKRFQPYSGGGQRERERSRWG